MAPSNTPAQAGPSGQAAAAPAEEKEHLTTLEDLVNVLTAGERTQVQKNDLLKGFADKEARDKLLANALPNGADPLDVLRVEDNTLGCLYILSARLNVQGAPPPTTNQLEGFCKGFSPDQARLSPSVVTKLAKGIIKASSENLALSPLRDLLLRYPPSPNHLTTLHSLFLDLCVSTHHYAIALPILREPIIHIDTALSDLTYNDNLLYHYAGGVVFGVLGRWKDAEEFFEIVVTSPAQTPAAIQLEALKKLTLVQLILYGKLIPPPKYTHATLSRLIKTTPYHTFARTYPQKVATLNVTIAKDTDLYRTEQNLGLVQQAIDRAPRWLIKKLTSTYLTLGLSDISAQVGLSTDEVRAVLLNMVEDGAIAASISADGTVTFDDATPQFSKADVDRALLDAQAQGRLLHDLERALNASKEYLAKALKHKDESWGAEDDAVFNSLPGVQSGPWAEESMYA